MEMQVEETPLALRRLWNLTRARLAGTTTAIDEPELVDNFTYAQVSALKKVLLIDIMVLSLYEKVKNILIFSTNI